MSSAVEVDGGGAAILCPGREPGVLRERMAASRLDLKGAPRACVFVDVSWVERPAIVYVRQA